MLCLLHIVSLQHSCNNLFSVFFFLLLAAPIRGRHSRTSFSISPCLLHPALTICSHAVLLKIYFSIGLHHSYEKISILLELLLVKIKAMLSVLTCSWEVYIPMRTYLIAMLYLTVYFQNKWGHLNFIANMLLSFPQHWISLFNCWRDRTRTGNVMAKFGLTGCTLSFVPPLLKHRQLNCEYRLFTLCKRIDQSGSLERALAIISRRC